MQECTYATTTCTSSAVNHSFVFIWWAILINQIKILLTLHLTQHVCCFWDDWGIQDGRFCLDDFWIQHGQGGQRAQGEGNSAQGAVPAGWGRQGGSTQGCRLSQKACPGSVPPAEDRGKTALLRPRLNAASLKAFFLSSRRHWTKSWIHD